MPETPVASTANAPLSPAQAVELIQDMSKTVKALTEEVKELKNPSATPARNQGPFVRKGEDPFTSRGFSFLKALGTQARQVAPEFAKVERELCDKLRKSYLDMGYAKMNESVLMPFSSQFIAQEHGQNQDLAREVGEVVRAGVTGYDKEEVMRYRAQAWGREKALSWVDESQGGALVGPPMMGELIELLRNNEVFIQAGARTIAMPPNGRIVWPKQTGPSTAYFVGMDTVGRTITPANPTTGDVTLQAKKLAILVQIPNELFRFSSVSIEQFVREDMARVLALKMDKTFLDGPESSIAPKGLINYANIDNFSAGVTGANGDVFQPEDVAKMVGRVEEQNAQFKAFVMRPLQYSSMSNRRSDAVVAGDGKGPFMFNVWREMQENYIDPSRLQTGRLNGYPVFKSTQVDNRRVKGNASNLSYILGGDFADYLIAMSGTMEFLISTQGDTPFQQDQTHFRGILHMDGAPRHEASFSYVDQLLTP